MKGVKSPGGREIFRFGVWGQVYWLSRTPREREMGKYNIIKRRWEVMAFLAALFIV